MADINSNLPSQDLADGVVGSAAPSEAILVGGSDGSTLRAISVSSAGHLQISLDGLSTFQTSQYTVGVSAVQITTVPLTNRKSISIKAICSSNNVIYIGNSSGVTTSTGYPLYNDDTLNMDLTNSQVIYAIASASNQTLCALEIA
jgi:hypothetical protein